MGLVFDNLNIDCHDQKILLDFWAALLGYSKDPLDPENPSASEGLLTGPPGAPTFVFWPVPEAKVVKNRLHLDLSAFDATRDEEIARACSLGAVIVADHRQSDGTGWAVLADPEGNEFCISRSLDEKEFAH